ncbi:hypothetical protein ACHAPF_000313 [Botrytis cinerea]
MWSDKVAAKNRNDGSDSKVLDERNEARYYALVGMKNLCQPDYGQKDNENSLKDLLDWAERDLKNIPGKESQPSTPATTIEEATQNTANYIQSAKLIGVKFLMSEDCWGEETANKLLHVTSVRVSDLEDSVILSPGAGIVGGELGKQFWRSPESWCKAKQSVSSDIFSMGIVAIYIMDKQMISYDGLKSEDFVDGEAWNQIIMRHISFFWIQDDYLEFLDHIGEDNPFFDRVIDMVNEFKGPMTPVRKWSYLDANFRDLVVNMARLDPSNRLSAREALEHLFFGSDNT